MRRFVPLAAAVALAGVADARAAGERLPGGTGSTAQAGSPDGRLALVTTGGGRTRVTVRSAEGSIASEVRRVPGQVSLAPDIALDRNGIATAVWTQGRRVWALRCGSAGCGRVTAVGRSVGLNAEPQVALDQRGRGLVLWRGRTPRGVGRLQWRTGPSGRFGRTHTLGELGSDLDFGADATGRFVAAWTTADTRSEVRTARRTSAEFTRPETVLRGQPASRLRLAVGRGSDLLAWRAERADSEGEPRVAC